MQVFGVIFLSSFLVLSCTTIPKRTAPISLPLSIAALVRSCHDLDGAANIQGFDKTVLIGTLDIEWLSKNKGWALEAVDPIARTLLTLGYDENTGAFSSTGPVAHRLPTLATEEGYLTVDGNFTGIRPSELPCYWSGYFPESEASKVYDLKRTERGYVMKHGDAERTVSTTLNFFSADKSSYQLCSDIQWTRLFGLIRRNIVLCTKKAGELSGTMTVLDDYRIHWISIDEQK